MNRNKVLFILVIIVLVSLIILVYHNNSKIDIYDMKPSWELYERNLENVKENMNEITESNSEFNWWKLKKNFLDDEIYQQTLNRIVSDIRKCYINYTDTNLTNNKILLYKNSKKITKSELQILNKLNNSCLSSVIKNYSNNEISNNKEKREKTILFLNSIDTLLKKQNTVSNLTYSELAFNRLNESLALYEISNWIKMEYYQVD